MIRKIICHQMSHCVEGIKSRPSGDVWLWFWTIPEPYSLRELLLFTPVCLHKILREHAATWCIDYSNHGGYAKRQQRNPNGHCVSGHPCSWDFLLQVQHFTCHRNEYQRRDHGLIRRCPARQTASSVSSSIAVSSRETGQPSKTPLCQHAEATLWCSPFQYAEQAFNVLGSRFPKLIVYYLPLCWYVFLNQLS